MNKLTQKAVMFGLDARIALLVLAIIAGAVSLSKGKNTSNEKLIETAQNLKLYKSMFLSNWEKLRFDGYYKNNTGSLSSQIELAGKDGRVVYKTLSGTPTVTNNANYAHPYNSKTYNSDLYSMETSFSGLTLENKILTSAEDTKLSDLFIENTLIDDIDYRLLKTMHSIKNQHGARIVDDIASGSNRKYAFKNKAYNSYITPIYIVEFNVDSYSLSDYILHVVLLSAGSNSIVDSTLPTNLLELSTFTPSEDDVVEIFSTREVYAKAKLDRDAKLEEIQNQIIDLAELTYAEFISGCETEASLSTLCDYNSNNKYDNNDRENYKNYIYFPASSISAADKYIDTTEYNFNGFGQANFATAQTDAETFLTDILGLPKYYAVDLFGNIITYLPIDNVSDTGPYTMEVYY